MSKSLSQDQKTIISLYAMVFVGAMLMLLPMPLVAYAGISSMVIGLLSAYIYRFKKKDDDIMSYHMNDIIGAVWKSTLILLIGVILFGCIVYFNGDLGPIHSVMESADKGVIPTEQDVYEMQYKFIQTNYGLITSTAIVVFLPYPLYLLYRMIKGVRKVVQS